MKTSLLPPTALPTVFANSEASTVKAMPGVRRAGAAVNPGLDEATWRLVQAIRAGGGQVLLAWGEAEQQSVAELTRLRLAHLQQSGERSARQHLARLQSVLAEQLAALSASGWRGERRAAACWRKIGPEIDELSQLLAAAIEPLNLARQARQAQAVRAQQAAAALARLLAQAENLGPQLAADAQVWLLDRQQSLLASQTLALELALLTDSEAEQLAHLIATIRQGVLLRLPAVLLQLGELPSGAHATRRYQLGEMLDQLIHFFRNPTP